MSLNDLRTAAQQALEAMEKNVKHLPLHFDNYFEAMNALRAALAEPVQEPQRKPLTEEEIYAAIKGVDSLRAVEVARAIERAHGITQSS